MDSMHGVVDRPRLPPWGSDKLVWSWNVCDLIEARREFRERPGLTGSEGESLQEVGDD